MDLAAPLQLRSLRNGRAKKARHPSQGSGDEKAGERVQVKCDIKDDLS